MSKSTLTIAQLRSAINEADEIILRAIAARFRAVESLKDLKLAEGKSLVDPAREEQLKKAWKARAKDLKIREELALLILDFLINESRRIQGV